MWRWMVWRGGYEFGEVSVGLWVWVWLGRWVWGGGCGSLQVRMDILKY